MSDIIGYGGGKGGGEQHTHYEASDSLLSIDYARVLDLVSEGPVLGLANGVKSVYLNDTPVQNADGSYNFKNITVDFRSGTQDQDPIPGFPSVESEIAVGVELKYGTPWTHAISNIQLDAIRITLGVPALSAADTSNGDVLGYKVDYQIELATDGGAFSVVLSNSFNGKTTSPYHRSARIDLPAATTGWTVRVTRLTANANSDAIADTTNVVSYTEVIDAKLRYPMSAIAGVQVDARQFSAVPTRAYDLYGRIVQVPSNYDPTARTYATSGTGTSGGAWDGTFKPAWTSNPAWIFRDLVLNDRYGLGQRISDAQVDKWALYKIARYCDELVPDGKGGTEPRFTCNVYLQTQAQAYKVLQDLASVFRGIAYWSGGAIAAAADMPSDPVYVYTAANVVGGKFARVGSARKTRATVALVSWNDMSDMGRAKVEYVEDAEGIKRYGITQVNLTAFGCTSQGQAQRVGRWALATARLETDAISFDVGLEGAIALPGQIVRVADPARMGRRNGGRIRAASGRVVTLDKAPTVNPGDKLTVILPTGVSETHNVVSVDGDEVAVDADWSVLPNAQSVWSVDNADLVAPLYRILACKDKGDGITYTITATQHEPGKFGYVENNVAVITQPQTSLDVSTQAAPASVTVSAYTVSLQDVQKLAINVECAPVDGATAYEGAYKRDNGNWVPIPRQFSPSIDIVDILPGSYVAKLAAVNSIGIASLETTSAATTVDRNAPPKNAGILLTPSAPAFHVTAAGANTPGAITFTASLLAAQGTISFTASGGTLSNVTSTSADLAYADMPGTSATVVASVTVNGISYSASCTVSKVLDGASGTNGLNTAIVYAYQRSAATPAGSPGDVSYDFAAKAITTTPLANGWQATIPAANGSPLYVTTATASAAGATDTIAGTEWSSPAILAQDGAQGPAGLNVATVRLYQRATSNTAPALPSADVTYTFASGAVSGLSNGWSASVPTIGGAYLFTTQATAAATTASDTIAGTEWAAAALVAQNGDTGTRGNVQLSATTTGTAWSDTEATAAVSAQGFGSPLSYDTVTLVNNDAGYVETRIYDGSAWSTMNAFINGNMVVDGTILARKIKANGLTIRNSSGAIVLDAETPLASQVPTNPNLASRISDWPTWWSPASSYTDTSSTTSTNGEFIILNSVSSGQTALAQSRPLGIANGAWYTVSFYAVNQSPGQAATIYSDLYYSDSNSANTIDTLGLNGGTAPTVPETPTLFTFTEQMPSTGNGPGAGVRIFAANTNAQVAVWDVKVELGKKRTQWCDNVITSNTAKNFVNIPALSSLIAILGTVDIADGGYLRSGQTGYDTGNGFFLGTVGGTPKFSIDAPNGAKLLFDPSASSPLKIINADMSASALGLTLGTTSGSTVSSYSKSATLASTQQVIPTITNGSGNYSYAWSAQSADGACNVSSTNGASSAGQMKGPGIAEDDDITVTLTVTDNVKQVSKTASIVMTISFT